MRLVLIDSRIDDITGISGSLTENTEYILFDFFADTIASIQGKITNTYESVAIIQHNYKLPTYQLVSSSEVSKVVGLETEDPNLETWKEYIGFLVWLKTERGAEFIDLMACDLWADLNWRYMIETVRARDGVYIRASLDTTGAGGNFVLESDGIDMVGVYFTEKILEYKYAFYLYQHDYIYTVAGNVNTTPGTAVTSSTVSTIASTTFNNPGEIAFDSLNNLYIADTSNHVIRVVPSQNGTLYGVNVLVGNTYVVAGTGASGTVITNGISNLSCTLNSPYGVAFDSSDNMFISDTNNHVVRVIPKTGGSIYGVSTTANQSFVITGNGIAGSTNITRHPFNSVNTISTNTTQTLAISVFSVAISDDGTKMALGIANATTATMFRYSTYNGSTWSTPANFTLEESYVNSAANAFVSITPDGKRIVCAQHGDGYCFYSDVASSTTYGPLKRIVALSQQSFVGIAITADTKRIIVNYGNYAYTGTIGIVTWNDTSGIYTNFSVMSNNLITTGLGCTRTGDRVVARSYTGGTVSLFIWNGTSYNTPIITLDSNSRTYEGFSFSPDGNVLFAAVSNNTTATVWYATWTGTNYGLFTSVQTAVIPANLNVRSSIQTMSATGEITHYTNIANTATIYKGTVNYVKFTPANYPLRFPRGIAIDTSNNLYIADTGNHVIKVIFNALGYLYGISTYPNTLYIMVGTDNVSGTSSNNVAINSNTLSGNTLLKSPYDVVVDSSRNLFISDSFNNVVRVVSNVNGTIFTNSVSQNRMYIVAGNAAATSTSGVGSGILASNPTVQLFSPRGLAFDGSNNLFISDSGSHSIRAISNKTGTIGTTSTTKNFIYTLIGTLNTPYVNGDPYTDILNTSSTLNSPSSCVYNSGEKNMYISDTGTHSVRQAVYFKMPNVPSPPIINSLIGGNTTLTLNYSPPYDDGGGAITNYYYVIQDGANPPSAYATIGSSPQTFSSLTNGNTYTISLVAQNIAGNSITSNATAIPGTTPSTPIINALFPGNTTLTANVIVPFNGGNTVSLYNYTVTTNDFVYKSVDRFTNTSSNNITGSDNSILNIAINDASTRIVYSMWVNTGVNVIKYRYLSGGNWVTAALDSAINTGTTARWSNVCMTSNGDTIFYSAYSNTQLYYSKWNNVTSYNSPQSIDTTTRFYFGSSVTADGLRLVTSSASADGGTMTIRTLTSTNGTSYTTSANTISTGLGFVSVKVTRDGSRLVYGSLSTSPLYISTWDGEKYPTASASVDPTGRRYCSFAFSTDNNILLALVAYPGSNPMFFHSTWNGNSYSTFSGVASTILGITNQDIYSEQTLALSWNCLTNKIYIARYYPIDTTIYVVDGSFNMGPSYTTNVTIPTSSTQTITGLTNSASYSVLVRAQNAFGNSNVSAISIGIPSKPSGPPTLNSLVAEYTTITVNLTAPVVATDTTPVTNYYYNLNGSSTYYYLGPVGQTRYTISNNITNGFSYTISLTAQNEAGNSIPSNALTATTFTNPDKPIISSIISGNTKLMVSLDPSVFNGGNAITTYYYSTDNTTYTSTFGNLTNPYTITGLTNGVSYPISFISRNIGGNSSASDPVTAIPSFTNPSKPIITSIQSETNRLMVSLNPTVFDGGDNITNYYYSTDGGNTYTSSNGIVTNPYAISGLTHGNTYSISIITENPAGNSIASDSVTATYYRASDSPTLAYLVPGNTTITAVIVPPVSNNGTPITDYYYNLNGSSTSYYLGAFGSTSYTISGLNRGTTYTVSITAKNSGGNSSPSAIRSTFMNYQFDNLYTVAGNVNTAPGAAVSTTTVENTRLNTPGEIAFDSLNNMYVADTSNHVIRVIPSMSGTLYGVNVTIGNSYVVAGTPNTPGTVITNGVSNLTCTLNFPYGVAFDSSDNMFISDTCNNVVRMIPKMGGNIYGISTTANQSYVVVGNTTTSPVIYGNLVTGISSFSALSTTATNIIPSGTYESAVTDDGTKIFTNFYSSNTFSYYTRTNTTTNVWSSSINITGMEPYSQGAYIGVTPNGNRIVNAPYNKRIYFSDLSGSTYKQFIAITDTSVRPWAGLSITEDGRRIVTNWNAVLPNNRIAFANWNDSSQNFDIFQLATIDPNLQYGNPGMTRNGSRIAFKDKDNKVRISFWDDINNTYGPGILTLDTNSRNYQYTPRFSPDGGLLFFSVFDNVSTSNPNIYYAIWNGSNYGTFIGVTSIPNLTGGFAPSLSISFSTSTPQLYGTRNIEGSTTPIYNVPFTLTTTTKTITTGVSTNLRFPRGIAIDPANHLYIADTGNHMIRVLAKSGAELYGTVASQNYVYKLVGTENTSGSSVDNVSVTSAVTLLNSPYDIAVDSSRNLYIADSSNNVVRVVSSRDQNIFTKTGVLRNKLYIIAGDATVASTSGVGSGLLVSTASVRLFSPRGVALDGSNSLFISDTGSHTVRVVSNKTGKIGNMSVTPNFIYTAIGNLNASYVNGNPSTDISNASSTLRTPTNCVYNRIDQNIYISDTGTNSVRQAFYSTPVVPSQPIIDSIISGNANVSLSFTSPINTGGSPITNYYYSLKDGSGPQSTYISIGSTPQISYVIGNLKNGNTYTLSLIVRNSVGNSITSNVTATAFTFPSTPIITTVIGGNTTLSVTLNATVSNGGSAITTYYYSTDNGNIYTSTFGNVTNPYTISGLTNGNTYIVRFITQNAAGNSSPSNALTSTPYTTPNKPVISSITGGNAAFVVTLDSSVFNGGNTYTTYYYSINNGNTYTSTGGNITNPYTISSGLTNGNTYLVSFITRNFAGNSAASEAVSATPNTVPGAPVIRTITPGNKTIDVSFGAPVSDGGSVITDYKYSLYPADSSYVSIGPVPRQFQLTDLSNGTQYTIYLKAFNSVGNTTIPSSATAIPRTFPDAPIINTLTPKNGAIDISFNAPTDNGGNAITNYWYSLYPDSSYNSMGAKPTTYTVSPLFNGTSYTIYLKATNSAGNTLVASNAIAIPRTIPSAPIIIPFIPGNRTIDLSFNAPSSDGGNAITDYAYSFFPDTSYNSIGPVPIQYQIPDLSNGTLYKIYLKAYNAAGNTAIASNAVAIPRTVPDAPVIKATILKNTAIDISFGAPTNNGGNAITDYAYSFFPDSDYVSMGATPTTYTVPNLFNGTSYTIYLKATNAAGNTLVASNTTGIPRTVPSEPIITDVILGNTTIDILFNASSSDGGNAITDYRYSFFPDSSYNNSVGSSPTRFQIPGLTNGNSYTIYMKAYNAAGNTLIASNVVAIPRTVPDAPIITHVIPGNTTIDISFNAPSSDGGNAITDYRYSFSPDTSYNESVGFSPTRFQIPGLSNGNSYTIYLKAYNDAGNTIIAANAVAIPRTVPDAPIINTLIPKNTAIDISFSAPAFNGGNAITNYWYSLFPDTSYNPMGATPTTYTVPDLSNGTMYTIYLKATNAAGNTLIASNDTAIPRTVPGAPIITDAILGNTTIDISFNAPSSDGGNAITDYRYSFFPDSEYNDSVGSSPTRFPITRLTNGNSYTIYMKAYNDAGNTLIASNVVAIPRTVPDAPVINKLIPKNGAIDISFSSPAFDGGNAIIDYKYSLSPDSDYNSMGPTPTTYTVPNLFNGNMYTIYVKATNAAGNTLVASNAIAIPRTVPSEPIITDIIPGNTTIDISFDAPFSDGGNAITDYRYSFFPDTAYNDSVGSSPTRFQIPGLTNGNSYTIYVKAFNDAGNTLIAANAVAIPRTFPDAPIINTLIPKNNAIDISFSAPENNGGNAITDYKYSFSPDSDYNSMGATPTTYPVPNLFNGNMYTIYVKATNAAGDTLIAANSTAIPRTVPSEPIITHVILGNTTIDISFNAPFSDGGNAITDYRYSFFPDSDYNDSVGSSPTRFPITRLTNGNSYTIYMKAYNAAGNTLIASNVVAIPRTVPSEPVIRAVTFGNTIIDISFGAPISDGGNAITNYWYSFYPDSSYNPMNTSSPITYRVSRLRNGTSYTIYLKASNDAGNTFIASTATETPKTFPGAPIINALTAGDQTVNISFSAPLDDGGNTIIDYAYSFFPDSSYNTMGSVPTVYTVPGLINGETYTFYLKATNMVGTTIIPSSATISPLSIPGPPVIKETIPGNTTIDISFVAPITNGGSAIVDYKYSFFSDSSYVSLGPIPTMISLFDLSNGTPYTIYLKATNEAGDTVNPSMTTATPRTFPDAPIINTLIPKASGIDISFSAPAFNGGNAITDYKYSLYPDSSYNSMGATPTTYPVPDLSNGTMYTIYVKATNAAGDTLIAANSTAIPRTVPSEPIITDVILGNTTIDISFNAPVSDGGNAITDYRYSFFPDSDYNESVGSSPTRFQIPGLTNGNTYTIYLKAYNAAGNTVIAANTVAIPRTVPDAPIINTLIPKNGAIDISFTAPVVNGGNAITNYWYSLDQYTSYVSMEISTPRLYTVPNLTNGNAYTIYMKATNAAGNTLIASNDTAIPRTVPSEPIITDVILGNTTIDISFNAPSSNGGNAITDYRYSFFPDTEYNNSVGSSPTRFQIPELTNGNTYTIYMKAYNAAGNTLVASNVVAIPRTVPDAPIINKLIPKNNAIDISFSAPENNGGNAITNYWYSLDQYSSYVSMEISTPRLYTVPNLTNGNAYTIYLKASNAAGNTFIASNDIAIPRTVPSEPIITHVILGNTTIDISFNAPSSDGGNAITDYRYSFFPDSSYNDSVGSSPTRFPITDLSNGKPYTIYMKAYNAAGNTVLSSNVVAIPRTVPDAPQIKAVTFGNTIIDISFGAPLTDGGNAITNYWYSFFPDSSYNPMNTSSPTTYRVSGLRNGTSYTIYLKASNAAGNTVTATSVTAIPKTFPGAPIINTATPGNASITISFSAPEDNGGNAITGYSYSYFPDSSYNPIGPSPTTFSIPGLNNGTSYTIYLKATNSVGNTLVASSTTLTPRTVPIAPTIDTIIPRDSALQVSLLPPTNNGGSSITGYYYTINDGTPLFGSSAINTAFLIPNLVNGNTYTIAVLAENAAGLSVASSSVSRIPYTVPDSPLIDTIVYTLNTITMTVNEPASNGGNAITGYYYVIGNSGYQILGNVSGVSYTISELANSRNTAVNIYAQNAAGYSAPFIIPSQNIPDRPEVVPNIIRLRSSFSNNLSYYKPGSLSTSGGGSGVTNSRAVKLRT